MYRCARLASERACLWRSTRTRLLAVSLLAAVTILGGPLACGPGVSQHLDAPPFDAADRARYARRLLTDARALRKQGRIEAAERTVRRGLTLLPNDSDLHRLRAELLAELGREPEAQQHRERADALDPPPPPLPENTLELPSDDLLVVLLPPPDDQLTSGRTPTQWPEGLVHRALLDRFALRMPDARVVEAPAEASASVDTLRRWLAGHARHIALSLRVDRAYCGESIKDGRFGLARLRVGLAAPDTEAASAGESSRTNHEHWIRRAGPERQIDERCAADNIARALEQLFELETFRSFCARRPGARESARWSRESIHLLFPALERRIASALDEARHALALGQLTASRAALARAIAIDPRHLDARSLLDEVDRALEITRQIARREEREKVVAENPLATDRPAPPQKSWQVLDPELTPAQRRRLEAQLADEQALRADLLAALAVLETKHGVPRAAALAALPTGTIGDPAAEGPTRARRHLQRLRANGTLAQAAEQQEGTELTTRVLYTPSGEMLARYYFSRGGESPILAEEDSSGDGRPDRWIAVVDGIRREVWERGRGKGQPDLHIVYAEDGQTLERVELDSRGDGRPERVFVYANGLLTSESRDTNEDGRFDLLEHFDDIGALAVREEDLDHDGLIDVRTHYRSGRVVRREIMNPEILGERP